MKKFTIITLLVSVLCGCQERLTREQWDKRFKPENTEQARAMGELQRSVSEAKAKLSAAKSMETLKFWCGLGFVGSIFITFLLSAKQKLFGIAGIAAAVAGFLLASADQQYPKYLAIGGVGVILLLSFYAVWLNRASLKAAVDYGQGLKGFISEDLREKYNKTVIQPKLIQKEIKEIKKKAKESKL